MSQPQDQPSNEYAGVTRSEVVDLRAIERHAEEQLSFHKDIYSDDSTCQRCLALRETLRFVAEIRALREALAPFAACREWMAQYTADLPDETALSGGSGLRMADLRRAAAVLARTTDD